MHKIPQILLITDLSIKPKVYPFSIMDNPLGSLFVETLAMVDIFLDSRGNKLAMHAILVVFILENSRLEFVMVLKESPSKASEQCVFFYGSLLHTQAPIFF